MTMFYVLHTSNEPCKLAVATTWWQPINIVHVLLFYFLFFFKPKVIKLPRDVEKIMKNVEDRVETTPAARQLKDCRAATQR